MWGVCCDPGLVSARSYVTHRRPLFLSAGATVNRANSCQSASSGFLEEPPEPPALQVEGPFRVGVGIEGSSLQCTAAIGKGSQGLEDTRHRHQGTGDNGVTLDQVLECSAFLSFLCPLVSLNKEAEPHKKNVPVKVVN